MRLTLTSIKRLLLLSGLIFVFSLSVFAGSFPDVSEEHWAGTNIDYWTEKGVINGLPDGTFGPDRSITRAEVAKVVAIALDLPASENENPFHDVRSTHWAYEYILACADKGILKGSGLGAFGPDRDITRQEMMVILHRISSYASEDPTSFVAAAPDGAEVASWAVEAVGTLMENAIVLGNESGNISPTDSLSRAAFVALMYRIEMDEAWVVPDGNISIDPTVPHSYYWSSDSAEGTIVYPQNIDGTDYLLLPAVADLSALTIHTANDTPLTISGTLGSYTGNTFDLSSIAAPDEDGFYSVTLGDLSQGYTLRILRAENMKSMFLSSNDPVSKGREYVDAKKGNSTKGSMVLMDSEGTVIYNDALSQIKSRGNSTFLYYPKKPYQIKLDSKTDLLGNGEKGKTWVLLANYTDATQFHDKSCKDLAKLMDMSGAPDCDWVNLYYDGEYRGIYLLSEKVDTGSTGIDIRDLEGDYEDLNENYGDDVIIENGLNGYGNELSYVVGLTDPDDISDGYLIEMNYHNGDENCWFKTTKGYAFNIKTPENLSFEAASYISEFYQEFENAVYAVNEEGVHTGVNPDTGKAFYEYCDMTSLVQMYMIYQFSHNQDAYVQSTFFYLSEGKLYAGPIWDSDQVYGTSWSEEVSPETELKWDYLVSALQMIPEFRTAAKEYYDNTFREIAVAFIQENIPAYAAFLSTSEKMNHVVWPNYYMWAGMEKEYPQDTNYQDIILIKKDWMNARILYLDNKFSQW